MSTPLIPAFALSSTTSWPIATWLGLEFAYSLDSPLPSLGQSPQVLSVLPQSRWGVWNSTLFVKGVGSSLPVRAGQPREREPSIGEYTVQLFGECSEPSSEVKSEPGRGLLGECSEPNSKVKSEPSQGLLGESTPQSAIPLLRPPRLLFPCLQNSQFEPKPKLIQKPLQPSN